jgi:hypothetical protein
MPMTPVQVEAVKNSWSKVTPIADQASALFYERLFTLDPSLRALFKPPMESRKHNLLIAINPSSEPCYCWRGNGVCPRS